MRGEYEINMSKVLGIDFGTIYLTSAVLIDNNPTLVPLLGNSVEKFLLPATVHLKSNNELLIGAAAKAKLKTQPQNTLDYLLKRLIIGNASVELRGVYYNYSQIISLLFAELKNAAEDFCKDNIEDAVIVLPERISKRTYKILEEAASLAGLNIIASIPPCTAIMLAYADKYKTAEEILALDFGGGFTNVTLGHVYNGMITSTTTSANFFFGGIDYDRKITDWLADVFCMNIGQDPHSNPIIIAKLRDLAENARIELSTSKVSHIYMPYIDERNGVRQDFHANITRKQMENLIEGNWSIIKDMLHSLHIPNKLDKIIVTGGLCPMPMAQAAVQKAFGEIPVRAFYNKKITALGAAIYGVQILFGNSVTKTKSNRSKQNSPYKILVTSTMSAGKSTFINALMGKNITKAENLACTDRIISINGELDGLKFIIKDSPGVNSSVNVDHRHISEKEISSLNYNLLIYIINARQSTTNDNSLHLEFVKEHIGDKPVLFIVNKADCLDPDEEDIDSFFSNMVEFVKNKGFKNPKVCLLSAKDGYIAKNIKESLDFEEMQDLAIRKRRLKTLDFPSYYERCFNFNDKIAQNGDDLSRLSGLSYIEKILKNYIVGSDF